MRKIILILLALALALSLFACGEKKEESKTPDTPDTEDTGTSEPEGKKPDEEEDFVLEIKETDTTMTWTIGTITYVFEHDGTNVTGMEYYTDCEDAATAMLVAKSMSEQYTGDTTVKLVEAKGRYVHAVMNEEGFLYHTVEELNAAKSILEKANSGETAND